MRTLPRPSPLSCLLALLPLAAGCTGSLNSDNGVVNVQFPGVQGLDDETRLVAQGAALCPDSITDLQTDATVTSCYAVQADGAWEAEGACNTAAMPGPAVLTLAPLECVISGASFTATEDTLTVEVVPTDDVHARLRWLEEVANEPGIGLVAPVPTDTVPADGEPVRVAPGATLLLDPELRRAVDGVVVAWSTAGMSVSVEGTGLVVAAQPEDESDIGVVVATGATGSVLWTLGDGSSWPLADIVADAGPYTLDSVYVAVIEADGYSQPLGARAVVRGASGEVVFGAPVTWSSDILQLTQGTPDGLPSSDYTGTSDSCRDPSSLSGEQHATLTATLGDQEVSVDVAWTPKAGDGAAWTPGADCLGDTGAPGPDASCGCAAASGRLASGVGLLGAVSLAFRRRR